MHFCSSKALNIIFSACLDEITGWFRLFQSTGEIKARFICFYFFLLGVAWLISDRRLGVALGSWDQVCILGWSLLGLFLFEMPGMSLENSGHCAGSLTIREAQGRPAARESGQSPFLSGYGRKPGPVEGSWTQG